MISHPEKPKAPIAARPLRRKREPSGAVPLSQLFGRTMNRKARTLLLNELLDGLDGVSRVAQGGRIPVTGLVCDSRRAAPGNLFIALEGNRTDGHRFVEDALHRGACAIVSERPGRTGTNATWVEVPDIRVAMAHFARRFYRFDGSRPVLAGITGTNGKTTVAYLLKHLFDALANAPVGMLGTIQYDLGGRTLPAFRTTPDTLDLYALLSQMEEAGCQRAVMEVSSHGLEQGRIHGLEFETAAFLNLTQDHLDYHGCMEAYFEAKAKLFDPPIGSPPTSAVINVDDPYGSRMVGRARERGCKVVTFGCSAAANLRAEKVRLGRSGSCFIVTDGSRSASVQLKLPGHYNVLNALAALAMGRSSGLDLAAMAASLESFPGVPGRMEKVPTEEGFTLFVDYAHTDDALRNGLSMLREITPGRLLLVFGCGGDRDRRKRPLMMRAAIDLADSAWATADNPRGESIEQIFADMRAADPPLDRVFFERDRRRAIRLAIEAAGPGDCVLIAGKGHETFQEFADSVVPFDDRRVARELLGLLRLGQEAHGHAGEA